MFYFAVLFPLQQEQKNPKDKIEKKKRKREKKKRKKLCVAMDEKPCLT